MVLCRSDTEDLVLRTILNLTMVISNDMMAASESQGMMISVLLVLESGSTIDYLLFIFVFMYRITKDILFFLLFKKILINFFVIQKSLYNVSEKNF